MRGGAVLRGSVAFALVLVCGLAAHAIAVEPAPAARVPLAFGDHAEYNVTIVDLDTGAARPSDPSRLSVEVGAPATVAQADGHPFLARPIEFRTSVPTLGAQRGQIVRTYWVDSNGDRIVAVGTQGTGSVAKDGLPVSTAAQAAGSSQAVAWRGLAWATDHLPCGFGGSNASADRSMACIVESKPGQAWPTSVVAPLADLLGSPGPGRLVHRLDLAESGRSLGAWSSPAALAALPPPVRAPRAVLGPDGTGPGDFALGDAFQALASAPTDPSARDLLQRHPDAYVAYARSYTAVDATGAVQRAWHVVLVGGSERVERAVAQEPGLAPGLPPTVRVLSVGQLDYSVDPAPSVLPPVGLAPSTLPQLDGLRLAFAAATGREATGWGFAVFCPSRSCFEVQARITLLAEDLAAAQPTASSARWQRSLASVDRFDVAGNGELLELGHVDYGRPVPDLLANAFQPASPRAVAPRLAFPFPSAPAAVTVGLLGLLAAGLAAAWPALKVYLPLFSRIEANRLLDHPVRRRVHDLVHAEPGIHSRQVALRLGIAGNTAHHHLERLVGAGYLGERRIAGYHCYFPRGGLDERLQDAVPVLKSQGAQAVLLAVESQGSPSFRSLMSTTGLGYATVHHHAERLWKAGLLSSEKDGKARRFRLTELGRLVAGQAQASLGRFPKLPKSGAGMDGAT